MTTVESEQLRVLNSMASRPATLIVGGPGTGKSTVLLKAAVDASRRGQSCVLLTSGRHAADAMRRELTLRTGGLPDGVEVKTAQAWAFTLLQSWAADRGRHTPELITGPGQDALLAALLDEAGDDIPWPEGITDEIRALPGFRAELRDLLTRASELGLDPESLRELGDQADEPLWKAASVVLDLYEDTLALEDASRPGGRGADRFDHAGLVHQAARVIADEALWSAADAIPRVDWIFVDDYQNATLATSRLLQVFVAHGAKIALTADPDMGVESFRGGIVHLPGRASLDFGAVTETLSEGHRLGPNLHRSLRSVTGHIGVAGVTSQRHDAPADTDDSVEVVTFPGLNEERFFIARTLKLAHLGSAEDPGLSYDDMAIVTRSRADHPELERLLRAAGIDVRPAPRSAPLRFAPVVAGLMLIVREAIGDELTDDELRAALASPLCGLSSADLRILSRHVAAWSLEQPGPSPLRDMYTTGAEVDGLDRLRAIVAAARQEHESGGTAEATLWAAWDASGCGPAWREPALTDAGLSAMLDDVLAMFRVAQRLVDRDGRVRADVLIDELASQDVAEDSIARAGRVSGVHLLTPSMAVGLEFPLVIVPGVQDGAWPNTRLRDGLFGASRLSDLMLGRLVQGTSSVMDDELRMFAFAMSRATKRLIVTASDSEDQSPSRFLALLDVPPVSMGATPLSMSMAGIVGQLRAILTDPSLMVSDEVQQGAAVLLKKLASEGERGANPRDWLGVREVTTAEPWNDSPYISPSAVESINACTLRWFLDKHAMGDVDDRGARDLGTFIHDLAERFPDGNYTAMCAAVDESFADLASGIPDGFERDQLRAKVDGLVRTLATYLTSAEPAESEKKVRASFESMVVSGRIDRVEPDCIVDFKTGSTVPTKAAVQDNPQLRLYQWLYERETGQPSMGAKLVYLGKRLTSGMPTERAQSGLTGQDREAIEDLLRQTSELLSGPAVRATRCDACRFCSHTSVCPLFDEGSMLS